MQKQESRQRLNIVDREGNVTGEEFRDIIHQKGLLHREVHVWLYTPKNKLIFQHRAKNKDTFPDLLDATAGGHVEIGDGWIDSALKELKEETGVTAEEDDIEFIAEIHEKAHDEVTGLINNVLRRVYALEYSDSIDTLEVEEGKAQGFEGWGLNELTSLKEQDKKRFINNHFNKTNLSVILKIKALAEKNKRK